MYKWSLSGMLLLSSCQNSFQYSVQECCFSFLSTSCYVKNSGKLQILQNVLLLCINYLHKVPFIFFLLMVNSLYPSDSTSLPLSSLGFSHSNYTKPVICYVPSIAPWGQIKFFLNLNLNLNIAQVVLDFWKLLESSSVEVY